VNSDYRSTELGMLPNDWRVDELGALDPFVTSGSRGWARYYKDTGAPFVRITNLSRGSIYLDVSDLKFVVLPQNDREGIRTGLEAGDLLVSITADIGIIGYVDADLAKPAYINQHIALVRFASNVVDAKFLAYFLAGERPQRGFRGAADQGAKAGMNLGGVRRILAAYPPGPEQRAIAEALSDVDALLSGLDRLIAKKRDLKQAAMQQLLTGQTRLPGFQGEWEVKRLGDHVRFLKNGTNSRSDLRESGEVKYLHYGDVHASRRATLDLTELTYLPAEQAHKLDRLADGDLVFVDASEDEDGVGNAVEIAGLLGTELVAGLHTITARFDTEVLANGFKAYLQFCPAFGRHLRRLAAGTKVLATNRSHIASAEISLPSVQEQTAIATVLSDMDAELGALEARRDKTRLLKQGMMQELLTGRTRLL
jgi:type I restriction enzyme S subunit